MNEWDCPERMGALLGARGITTRNGLGSGSDALVAWRTFCALAADPIDGVGDHRTDDMLTFESYVGVFESDWGLGYPPVGTEPDVQVLRAFRSFTFYELNDEVDSRSSFDLYIACELRKPHPPRADITGYGGLPREPSADRDPERKSWVGGVENWTAAAEASEAFAALTSGTALRYRYYIDA